MKKWLELVVDTAKQSYSELFNREPDVSIHVVERDKWKEELEKSGASPKDRPAVYLVDKILIRDDATYFDVLHELGHEALYTNMGLKEQILRLKNEKNTRLTKYLEKKLPLEFLENAANQYAKVIGSRMKYRLPELIKKSLEGINPRFVAFNGSVQREGWGRDIDIWIVTDYDFRNEPFPEEWDVEIVPVEVFEEGVENSDGIYIDLSVSGDIVADTGSYTKRLLESLKTKPSSKEIDYHFKRAYRTLSLAKSRLVELRLYKKMKLMEHQPADEVILQEANIPFPELFFNPLSYAVSYAYLGSEYSCGNRPVISNTKLPLLEHIRKAKLAGYYPKPEKLISIVEEFVKDAAKISINNRA